ncbi:MFS transporter [Streptomyces sp. NPDC087428]|uniref:MFS transporter n=1 Tax=Streptomyces sp. NPDC087428 TaxID=3365788 RepID=UPI003800D15D
MLLALSVDRTGSGLWAASSVLYLTFVTHLSAQQIGVLLGAAGVAGIAGSPLAGRLAGRFPLRPLLVGCHLLRLVTLALVLMCSGFEALLPVIAVTYLGDRAAKTLEMLFATRAAGERRAAYQALSRSAANAGYGVGAGIAAIGLAVGTTDAYRALILGNALSFAVAAVLVWRTGEPRETVTVEVARAAGGAGGSATAVASRNSARPRSPWRDRGYLRFVLLDISMNLDDSVLGVGLPLWLVNRTSAPHALVPAFLVINTVLVVVLQLAVSKRAEGPHRTVRTLLLYGGLMFVCCALLAGATRCGTWTAAAVLLAAAVLVTLAELMRSVSSWELAVLLAPPEARAAYLGVAGMSQSIQKSAGPPLLTGVVMAAGPAGWLVLGTVIAGLAVAQRRCCAGRFRTLARRGRDTRGRAVSEECSNPAP